MAVRLTETAHAKLKLALVGTAFLGGCGQSVAPLPVASDDEACARTIAALAANGTYQAEQMASCEGGMSEENPRFYVLRLNGYCHEEICGSVLMGWYGVEVATGAVYEWDINESQPGPRLDQAQ